MAKSTPLRPSQNQHKKPVAGKKYFDLYAPTAGMPISMALNRPRRKKQIDVKDRLMDPISRRVRVTRVTTAKAPKKPHEARFDLFSAASYRQASEVEMPSKMDRKMARSEAALRRKLLKKTRDLNRKSRSKTIVIFILKAGLFMGLLWLSYEFGQSNIEIW